MMAAVACTSTPTFNGPIYLDQNADMEDVLLGPGVNIYRSPLNGRNFEYMGEDPYLSSHMVVPYVQDVQKNGVAVCVKHFALNNEETYRHQTDVDLDDRALYEIYLPAFKAAVQKGGAWTIMGSYNLYRGQYLCSNERLLNTIPGWKAEKGEFKALIGAASDDIRTSVAFSIK